MKKRDPNMTNHGLLLLCLLVLNQSSLLQSCVADSPIKVYFDSSRREGGKYVWHKQEEVRSTTVADIACYDLLKRYDLMVVFNKAENCDYLPEELKAIEQFVQAGGGLLLIADPKPMLARKLRKHKAAALDKDEFSSNQIAALFGVTFKPTRETGVKPHFADGDPIHAGLDVRTQEFAQAAGVVLSRAANPRYLVRWSGGPAAVGGEYGRGRFLIAALPELLEKVNDRHDSEDERDATVARETPVFMTWARWLSANSPVRNHPGVNCPRHVNPGQHAANDFFDIYYIPQLQPDAAKLVRQWEAIWPKLGRWLGVLNPLEIRAGEATEEKLIVTLKPTKGSGHSAGNHISVSAWSDDPSHVVGIFGHETGHKILGGCNSAVSEGFANWVGDHAVAFLGMTGAAEQKRAKRIERFRRAEPSGRLLDIGLPNAQGRAANGKWVWVMSELTRQYGEDLTKLYLAALRRNVQLCGAGKKRVNGQVRKLSMEDHVTALSQAAGTDLHSWFRKNGITVTTASPSP